MNKYCKIIKNNDNVVINISNYTGIHSFKLTNRYLLINQKDRWDFYKNTFMDYIINYSEKRFFIGFASDYFKIKNANIINKPSDIYVMDLNKIFPEIAFIENNLEKACADAVLGNKNLNFNEYKCIDSYDLATKNIDSYDLATKNIDSYDLATKNIDS